MEYSIDGKTYQESNTFTVSTPGTYTIYFKAIDAEDNATIVTRDATVDISIEEYWSQKGLIRIDSGAPIINNGEGLSAGGGGGGRGGGGGYYTVTVPAGLRVYYTLSASYYGSGVGSAIIKSNDTTVNSISISLSSSSNTKSTTKTGSFTTTTSTEIYFGGQGSGGDDSGGSGYATIEKITDSSGNKYKFIEMNVRHISYYNKYGSSASQKIYEGLACKIAEEAPTNSNFIFKGWGTSSAATEATYQPGATYTGGSIVLYAIWESVDPSRTLTFSGGSGDGTNLIFSAGGGENNGGNGRATVSLPAGVTVYYTLKVSVTGSGSGTAKVYYPESTEIDSYSSSSGQKSGSFGTTTAGTLVLYGEGGGATNSGASGVVTITKIVGSDGKPYILAHP